MKKLLMILATIILSISIVGCSSSSKKYDSDINKVISYENKGVDESKQIKRENVNIKVYENVDVNAGAVQGKKTLYAIQEKKGENYEFYFIRDTDGKVDEFGSGWNKRISEIVSKPVYEEINIK